MHSHAHTLQHRSPGPCKRAVWQYVSNFGVQRVWAGTFLGRPTVVKQRFAKKYRNPVLDFRLNTTRLKQVSLNTAARGCSLCTCLHEHLASDVSNHGKHGN